MIDGFSPGRGIRVYFRSAYDCMAIYIRRFPRCRKGRRPSYLEAASPDVAERLYETFIGAVGAQGIPTATGRFRSDMQVALVNDGPVTLLLDSRKAW